MLNPYFVFQVAIFLISFIAMWIGSNKVIDFTIEVSKIFRISRLFIGFIFIGLATAMPELAVVVASSFAGISEMASGNIMGANFNNISLVLGLSAFLGNGLCIDSEDKKNLLTLLTIITLIFLYVFAIGSISIFHGIALIIFYFIIFAWMLKRKMISDKGFDNYRDRQAYSIYEKFIVVFKLVASICVVIIAAEFAVNRSEIIANMLNLTTTIFGATIFSIVTTVPELALSSSAIYKKQHGIALGTLIGSMLPHICLCLGLLTILSNKTINIIPLRTFSIFIFTAILIIGLSILLKNKISKIVGLLLFFLFLLSFTYNLLFYGP